MQTNTIDAALCARMFLAGAKRLESKKDWINELNVFPVPDGDTGTNMTMTVMSAAKEVAGITEMTMAKVSKAMSSGSLRGARGNSGVILSQLLRGFSKVIKDCDEIDPMIACSAFQKAVETAYKAVMKPKEGTILTVARGFCDEALRLYEEDPEIGMDAFLQGAIAKAVSELERTPELLPVLKEAGVVDSGGQGLVEILQGAYDLFAGKVDDSIFEEEEAEENAAARIRESGYCVELVITPFEPFREEDEIALEQAMSGMGEDVCVLGEDQSVKVHVHAKRPGDVINHVMEIGRLGSVKVDSLLDPHREKVVKEADRMKAREKKKAREQLLSERKETGFISVSCGEGLSSIFADLGTDQIIEGGQTMNPSTEDMLNAIEAVNADNIFILPNNKNIILAASQAQRLVKDKKVYVIPTRNIPQGISALISYNPEKTCIQNESEMCEAIRHVETCQMTYAVRDTHIDDKEIHEGDIMGVGDKGILAVGRDLKETTLEAVGNMVRDDSELISVYYGCDVTEEDAGELADQLSEAYPGCEVELNRGDQPIYYYIVSVE